MLRGTFQVLDGNILMLVHPSSGDNIFYKVRDGNCIILIDSFGNEPEGETAKFYVLKKKKQKIHNLYKSAVSALQSTDLCYSFSFLFMVGFNKIKFSHESRNPAH